MIDWLPLPPSTKRHSQRRSRPANSPCLSPTVMAGVATDGDRMKVAASRSRPVGSIERSRRPGVEDAERRRDGLRQGAEFPVEDGALGSGCREEDGLTVERHHDASWFRGALQERSAVNLVEFGDGAGAQERSGEQVGVWLLCLGSNGLEVRGGGRGAGRSGRAGGGSGGVLRVTLRGNWLVRRSRASLTSSLGRSYSTGGW